MTGARAKYTQAVRFLQVATLPPACICCPTHESNLRPALQLNDTMESSRRAVSKMHAMLTNTKLGVATHEKVVVRLTELEAVCKHLGCAGFEKLPGSPHTHMHVAKPGLEATAQCSSRTPALRSGHCHVCGGRGCHLRLCAVSGAGGRTGHHRETNPGKSRGTLVCA